MRYLVTIDRNEYNVTRRHQFWKPLWWKERASPPSQLGRTIFLLDREKESLEPLFVLPQKLDSSVFDSIQRSQGWAAKAFTRGLRTVKPLPDGGFVVSDVFGVYHTDAKGNVLRHLSLPIFCDLHSAFPNADNSRVLVSSTGVEEVQEVGWDGTVHRRIAMSEVFGIRPSRRVSDEMKRHADFRQIPFEIQREIFHVNWAQWIEEGKTMLISLYVPGMVAILRFAGPESCVVERKWSYYPKCHAPILDGERGSFVVAISGTDQVVEADMKTGEALWMADNIRFGKSVVLLDGKRALVGDCNGRRVVELCRETGKELWSHPLPGIPYSIEAWP